MNILLIYCYITNQYHLIPANRFKDYQNPELLFEFGEDELRLAKKILNNLRIEKTQRERSELVAA